MKLKTLKPSVAKGYLRLGIENEGEITYFTVSEMQYSLLGSPLIEDEIDEEKFSNFSDFDEYNKARKKALNILSFGDNSEKELVRKLVRAGIRLSVAKSVAEQMQGLGYINESRQLERLVENEVNVRLTGPRKFIPKLMAKGYSSEKIRETVEALADKGTIDLTLTREKLIAGASDNDEIKKILYKHGF